MIMPAVARGLTTIQSSPAALLVRGGAAAMVVPDWVNFCANAAPIASMFIFFAPYPTIDQVAKNKNVGSLPLLPYSSMIANCFLWTAYGILKQESKVWATNGIGIAFGLFYFLRFVQFARVPKSPSFPGSITQHITACVGVLAIAAGIMAAFPVEEAAAIIGNLAVLVCVAMFGSPLASLTTVLRTKSASSIPLPFTLATIVNCILWFVAGLLKMKDVKIYFPNILGLTFGVAQVALKLIFGNGSSSMEREEPLM